MIYRVTFYEHPPDGGRKVRRLVRREVDVPNLTHALAWVFGTVKNTRDENLLARVCQVRIEPVEPESAVQPEQVQFAGVES